MSKPHTRCLHVVVVVIATAVAGVGCATTTTITTEKPGASVMREGDDEALGVTPYEHSTSMWLWEAEKLEVKDQRGRIAEVELKRSEVDIAPMAGGVCLTLTGCGAIAGIPLILAGGMVLPPETPVDFDGAKAKKGKGKRAAAAAAAVAADVVVATVDVDAADTVVENVAENVDAAAY
jgi:hypothetical protein